MAYSTIEESSHIPVKMPSLFSCHHNTLCCLLKPADHIKTNSFLCVCVCVCVCVCARARASTVIPGGDLLRGVSPVGQHHLGQLPGTPARLRLRQQLLLRRSPELRVVAPGPRPPLRTAKRCFSVDQFPAHIFHQCFLKNAARPKAIIA